MLRRSAVRALRDGAPGGGAPAALWAATRGLAPAASTARSDGWAALHGERTLEGVASESFYATSLKGFLEVLAESNKRNWSNCSANLGIKGISSSQGPLLPFIDRAFGRHCMVHSCIRTLTTSSSSSQPSQRAARGEARKDLATSEDPFDAPTYNIPEKPVTFTEGASYSIIILLGLAVAAAAAYAVFKELIFEPKEYKIYGKALERVQNDSQVRVRIGSPITGYGQESRNRAARQRIAHKTWTDEDGVEHVEVNFFVRGPHGAGKVYSEMFRDKVDREWKFTYLIVDIVSPSQARLMLESYIPT